MISERTRKQAQRSFGSSTAFTWGVTVLSLGVGVAALGCSSDSDPETQATESASPGAAGSSSEFNDDSSAGNGGSTESAEIPQAPLAGSGNGEDQSPTDLDNGDTTPSDMDSAADGEPDLADDGMAAEPDEPITPTAVVPGAENYDCSPSSGEALPAMQLVPVVTGLNNPIYVTHAPGETDRLFILEQAGTIQVARGGEVAAAPFLDLTSSVDLLSWEQGLLGLAFHPNYADNGLFYVHYNGLGDGSAVIAEYRVSDDADVADPTSERIVLTVPAGGGYHNGGSINFGPDGLLYIGIGDGGGLDAASADAGERAQDVTDLRGSMLRIDPTPSTDLPYSLPAGNLADVNAQAAPEIWSIGLRNPYRSNFDACTGALFIGDVGNRAWEEVNVEPPATGHRNYGWPTLEGPECLGAPGGGGDCDRAGLIAPVHAHPNTEADGPQFQAVIGGSVYRGSAIPALRGTYIFTDLYGGTRAFIYDVESDVTSDVVDLEPELNPAENDQGLVAVQTGGDGELYFVSRGSSGGGGPFNPQDPIGTVFRLEVE